MKNKPVVVSIALVLLIGAGVAPARADEPFKLDRKGWTVVGPAQSAAEIILETDADQKPAFVITPSSPAGAWVVSQPLPAITGPVTLSMRVQRRSGN
ncbi:MAG: hypothetical protein KAW89_03140, partial [Armatimonadetes bacterium]|nr:hypothetical protein [Armatimonadota bacterium]